MRARAIAAALLSALVFTMLPAHSATAQAGYVDVQVLLRKNPFYAQLAQYDRAIAALRATQSSPRLAPVIDRERAATESAFDAGSAAFRRASLRQSNLYAQREREGLSSLLAIGSTPTATQLFDTYNRDAAQIRNSSNEDLTTYRGELAREEKHAIAQLNASMRKRISDASTQREAQLRESELAYAYELARNDADRVLALRLRLQALHLPNSERRHTTDELNAIFERQREKVAAMQSRDARTLAAYRAEIAAGASGVASREAAQLQDETQINMAARQAALQTQDAMHPLTISQAAFAETRPEELRDGILSFSSSDAAVVRDATGASIAAFDDSRRAIAAEMTSLRDTDANGIATVKAQIATLQRERQALREQIVASILADAQSAARARGLSTVRTTRDRGSHVVDLTPVVQKNEAAAVGSGLE